MTITERRNRIAILSPMRSELRPLVRRLALKPSRSGNRDLLWGTLSEVEIVATTTGIGTRAAAHTAEKILDSTSVQHLFVVGIAGGIGPQVDIGALVVPERVVDLDTGAEYRPSRIGYTEMRGTLVTSDQLLTDSAEIARLAGQGVVAIDMETAAIAAVCERRQCGWSVFRAISDCAGDGLIDPAMAGLAGPDDEPHLLALIRWVLMNPKRIPHLIRLGRGLQLATNAAAAGAVNALAKMYALPS